MPYPLSDDVEQATSASGFSLELTSDPFLTSSSSVIPGQSADDNASTSSSQPQRTFSLTLWEQQRGSHTSPANSDDEWSDLSDGVPPELRPIPQYIEPTIPPSLLGGKLPDLPISEAINNTQEVIPHFYHHKITDFRTLHSLTPECRKKTSSNLLVKDIHTGGLIAKLYSRNDFQYQPKSRCLFILAAHYGDDIVDIHIMNTRGIKNILVLTETEFQNLPKRLFHHNIELQVLVVHGLHSEAHGDYSGKTESFSAKRLAALIFAHHLKLNYFMMSGSDMESISFNKGDAEHNNSFSVLTNELTTNDACVIGVSRNHSIDIHPDKFATNLIMVNMLKIRQKLTMTNDMFYLMPQSVDANNWAEIFYFQMMLALLFSDTSTKMISREKMVAAFQGQKITLSNLTLVDTLHAIIYPQDTEITSSLAPYYLYIERTIDSINKIIEKNYQRYENQRDNAIYTDIFAAHQRVQHGLPVTSSSQGLSEINREENVAFNETFKSNLSTSLDNIDCLRPYQREALTAVAANHTGQLGIPTGCGKTMLAYCIIRAALLSINADEMIVLITPQLNLLNQLYRDFHYYYEHVFKDYDKFSFDRIIKISSAEGSINVDLYKINQSHVNLRKVLLFCFPSFKKFIDDNTLLASKIKLFLFDEHQAYQPYLKAMNMVRDDNYLVACSATPPEDVNLPIIYHYSITDAIRQNYLATVIIHGIDLPYSKTNLAMLTTYLPELLKQQYHPSGNKLRDVGSITFFPGIAECTQAHKKLKEASIAHREVHSQQKKRLRHDNSLSMKQHFLAVEILRYGYHNPEIYLVIILQDLSKNTANNQDYLTQMIGRGLRRNPQDPNKTCLIITWEANIRMIQAAIKHSPITIQPHADFLNQHYSTQSGQEQQPEQTTPFSWILDDRLSSRVKDLSQAAHSSFALSPSADELGASYSLSPGASPGRPSELSVSSFEDDDSSSSAMETPAKRGRRGIEAGYGISYFHNPLQTNVPEVIAPISSSLSDGEYEGVLALNLDSDSSLDELDEIGYPSTFSLNCEDDVDSETSTDKECLPASSSHETLTHSAQPGISLSSLSLFKDASLRKDNKTDQSRRLEFN